MAAVIATQRDSASGPIAYAIGIGGGWTLVCPGCVAAHREDVESDLGDVLPDAELIYEFSRGHVAFCSICDSDLAR